MPQPSIATRKRTRSTNISESNTDHQQPSSSTSATPTVVSALPTTTTVALNAPPKRQRNNPPAVQSRTNYSLRNRSLTPDPRHSSTRFPSLHSSARSTNTQRYNLRSRQPQSQVRLPHVATPHPVVAPRRARRQIPTLTQPTTTPAPLLATPLVQPQTLPPPPPPLPPPPPPPPILPTPPVVQPRQYRIVYISDDDDPPTTTQPMVNTTFNLVTDDEDEEPIRPQPARRRTSRTTSGAGLRHTRSRTATVVSSSATSTSSTSTSSTTMNTSDNGGVSHIRLNRAIEIVIDSIQSLEGAVNNFDQLVFGLIYGRLGTRTEFESIEGMIRLSRILNLNLNMPTRLSQTEIDALPKIIFDNNNNNKMGPSSSSILLAEKCPICLTEFDDQETINKLHCTHLFHLPCISTWLSENDSCPTCRRKVMGD